MNCNLGLLLKQVMLWAPGSTAYTSTSSASLLPYSADPDPLDRMILCRSRANSTGVLRRVDFRGSVFSLVSPLLCPSQTTAYKAQLPPCIWPSSAMAVYVTSADGTKIWAESTGDPAKPAVVFIPGFSCTSLVFDKQWVNPFMKANLFMVREIHSSIAKPVIFPVR